MSNKFSLAHLTVLGCSPDRMVNIASNAGYDHVSLRFIPLWTPGEPAYLPENKFMVRETRAALAATGVTVLDLELARIRRDIDPKSFLPAMELAADLGARHVISSAWTTESNDRDFIVDRYGEICDLAKPFGLTVDLEFPSFSRLTNLQEAADIVRRAGRSNSGIMIDTLYVHFSRVGLDELDALPRDWFHLAHICDGPAEIPTTRDGLVHVARDERLYLGEGGIDVATILDHLPAIPYSIELPHAARVNELGYEEHARRCLETAKQYLAARSNGRAAVAAQ